MHRQIHAADRRAGRKPRVAVEHSHPAVAAAAGDLLIWNSLLPHGNGPYHAETPRLAQYISMYPPVEEEREWPMRLWRNSEPQPPRAIFPGDPHGWEQRTGPARLTELGRRLFGLDP